MNMADCILCRLEAKYGVLSDRIKKLIRVISKYRNGDLKILQLKEEFEAEDDCLGHKKGQFSQVKHGVLELEARVAFLRCLSDDPSHWPSASDSDEHMRDLSAKLSVFKEENAALKEDINQTTETVGDSLHIFEGIVTELELKTEQLEKARARLGAARQEKQKYEGAAQARAAKLSVLGECDKVCQKMLPRLKSASTDNCQEHQGHVAIASQKQNCQPSQRAKLNSYLHFQKCDLSEKNVDVVIEAAEAALQSFRKLEKRPIQVRYSDPSKMVIEFQGRDLPDAHSMNLFLTLQLKQGMDGTQTVTNVTVNDDAFHFEDILGAECHSVPAFVERIYKRWLEYKGGSQRMNV